MPNRQARRKAAALLRTQTRENNRKLRTALRSGKKTRLNSASRLTLTAAAAVVSDATEGELPTFTIDAYSGGLMQPQLEGIGWDGDCIVDISGLRFNSTIPVHRDHDTCKPVGHASVETGERVTCKGVFSIDNEHSREIRAGAKNGFPWKGSVGLSNMLVEFIDAGQTTEVNGKQWQGPLMVARQADLDEVSIVTIPGDSNVDAVLAAAKQSNGVDHMDFSAWLKEQGFDEASLSDTQLAALRKAYDAEMAEADSEADGEGDEEMEAEGGEGSDDEEEDDSEEEDDDAEAAAAKAGKQGGKSLKAGKKPNLTATQQARNKVAAEEQRIADIKDVCETLGNPDFKKGTKLSAHAIREGWDAARTALYATRHSRPRTWAVHTTSQTERGSIEALQAGVMLRAGRRIDNVLPEHSMVPGWQSRPVNDPARQRVMDQAQEFRDLSMTDYCDAALRASGHQVSSGGGRSNRMARLQAAFSTGAVSSLYNTVIGSMAIASYQESGDFSAGWTSENDELNLEEHTRVRLETAPDLTIQPETGTADETRVAANNERVKADRFSRQANIDEIAFINDNFQLLREIPTQFGQAASRLRPNLVASVLLANAVMRDNVALFNAVHSNLLTGSPLSSAAMRTARALLGKQREGDASLNLQATHLLVPTDLGDLAFQLCNSIQIFQDNGQGGTNPLAVRGINPVEEARLANGVVDPRSKQALSGSISTWYLISAEGHTIEVQFLAGTGRVPVVSVENLTGGQFGLNITVKHYAGAKALDWRSMVQCQA
jgi:hypothetical protein